MLPIELLSNIASGIAANVIYDLLKDLFSKEEKPSIETLKQILHSRLDIENTDIVTDQIINLLARNGDIIIEGSQISPGKSISMVSSPSTAFELKKLSSSRTNDTSIKIGVGKIRGQGRASIRQSSKGIELLIIHFCTNKALSIKNDTEQPSNSLSALLEMVREKHVAAC